MPAHTNRSGEVQTTEEIRQANENLAGLFTVLTRWNTDAPDDPNGELMPEPDNAPPRQQEKRE